MKTVGVLEAKSQFSKLIREAEQGEEIVITRHGAPAVRLLAVDDEANRREQARRYLEGWAKLRGSLKLAPGETVKDLINAGRKY